MNNVSYYDDASDVSSESYSEYGGGLPLNWIGTVRHITPNVHRIVISISGDLDAQGFAWGVEQSVEHYRHIYGQEWRMSGLVFDVVSINPTALHHKDQVVRRSIRLSDDLLNSSDVFVVLKHHIEENTASAFVRGGSEEISDSVVGTYVKWNLKTVKLWFEKFSNNDIEMTVVGETEMHPGVFV